MLARHNGVDVILKRQMQHLTEQHCVARTEDLGIDDAWNNVPLQKEWETLLRIVYSIRKANSHMLHCLRGGIHCLSGFSMGYE